MSKISFSKVNKLANDDSVNFNSSKKKNNLQKLSHEEDVVGSAFKEGELSSNLLKHIEKRKNQSEVLDSDEKITEPYKHPILGAYLSEAEDCKGPSYQDNSQKTIYKVKVNKMGGAWVLFMPEYGPGASFATGSVMEGSYQVIVKGHDNSKPKSWELRSWLPVGRDARSGYYIYGWRNACLPLEKALKLEGVQTAIKHFSKKN